MTCRIGLYGLGRCCRYTLGECEIGVCAIGVCITDVGNCSPSGDDAYTERLPGLCLLVGVPYPMTLCIGTFDGVSEAWGIEAEAGIGSWDMETVVAGGYTVAMARTPLLRGGSETCCCAGYVAMPGYTCACTDEGLVFNERLGTGRRIGCSLTPWVLATGAIVLLGCLLSRFAGGSVMSSSEFLFRLFMPARCLPESGDS